MSKGNTALIDTVDSGAHYQVLGTVLEVTDALTIAGRRNAVGFVAFELAGRDHRAIFIAPDKVIAVLEPA